MTIIFFWAFLLVVCYYARGDQTVYSTTPPPARVFNPREYESHQHLAWCDTNHLQYTHLVNPTAEKTLLFVHGWPGLWSIWANQITHFSPSYSLLMPTLRGFGPSTHPKDVQTAGAIHDHTRDLFCIMRTAQVSKVVCVGHDWGAQVCWEAARARPDLVEAVAGVVVPYLPSAGPFLPIEQLIALLPHLAYQAYFAKQTEMAIQELNKSILRTVRAILRTIDSPPPPDFLLSTENFLGAWANTTDIPAVPFFSEDEEAYLVEQLGIQGFNYTLEFYTNPNRLSYYHFVQSQGNFTIPQPALHVVPTGDPVADWSLAAKLLHCDDFIPLLQTATIHAAHWPHLERPNEFNAILAGWLDSIPQPKTTAKRGAMKSTGEL